MSFGENLKRLRLAKGLSRKEVAANLGMTVVGYGYYELDSREPKIKTVVSLANMFGVSTDAILIY